MPRMLRMTRSHTANKNKVQRANDVATRPKLRKRTRPHRLRTTVLSLIPGTFGIWSALARRLGCCVATVQRTLEQPGWENVLERFRQEKSVARDMCLEGMYNLARHSCSDQVRLQAQEKILTATHPDFMPKSKLTIEGGEPIKVAHLHYNVPPEIMNASIADRLKVIELLDEVVSPDVHD